MTSPSLHELIDSIRTLLDGHPSVTPAEVVAQDYARHCRVVNERLSRIAPMLAGGGEIQALQLAEQAPRVLELAIALSFGGEVAWQDHCRDHKLEVAPLIDARTIAALQAVEEKGVSSNHPLYRDYRSAVSARDDAKAHELIKIITRLNPSDENAAKEVKRLERKGLQVAVAELRAALASKNADEVMRIMPRVEQAGDADAYGSLPEWREALAIRQRHREQDATRRMPELLLAAEQDLKAGDWRQAEISYGEFAPLLETYGAPALADRASAVARQLEQHRAEATRISRISQLLAELSGVADGVEARETTRAGLTPEFAGPLLESLVRDSQQLEDLQGEVPPGARARIDATRAKLAGAVERGRTTRRLRIIAGTAVTLLIALVVIGVGLLAFRASGHAAALTKLRAANSTAAVADLITRVEGQEPLLLRFPTLSSAVADAGRWLETATSDAGITERELERLEQARGDDFATWTAPELAERLEQTTAMVAKLPADLGAAAKARLAVLQNDGERNLRKRQETADGHAREAIRKATALLETLDDQSPASAAGQAVEDAETTLAPFLTATEDRPPLLRLPAATETDLADLGKRLATVQGQAEAATSALAELALAKSPNDYRTSLESLAETRFQEAAAARAVLDGWPDDDRVKAFLLFKNNLAALQAARSEVDGELPLPATATAQDRELIGELMKSETLNGLWEVVWKRSKGPPQNCLSKKELERHGLRSWSGKVAAYPQHPSSELKYVETRLGGTDDVTVIVNRISPVSAMMHQLRLPSLLNDSGTEYRSSILPLIDQVTRNQEASALARAYVLSRFFKLLRGREQAWGLHYCPELSADIAAFRELEIQWPLIENSWLLETKPAYSKPWEEYFASRGERSFAEPMRRMKSAAGSVIGRPLMLAGRVDAGGNLNLVPSPNPRLLMGIGRSKTAEPGPRMVGIAEAGATELNSAAALLPFSPLLTLEIPETDRNFLLTLHP